MERWVEYYLDVFLIEEEFFEVIDEFVRGKVLGNNNIFVEIFKVNKEFFFF